MQCGTAGCGGHLFLVHCARPARRGPSGGRLVQGCILLATCTKAAHSRGRSVQGCWVQATCTKGTPSRGWPVQGPSARSAASVPLRATRIYGRPVADGLCRRLPCRHHLSDHCACPCKGCFSCGGLNARLQFVHVVATPSLMLMNKDALLQVTHVSSAAS